MKIKNIIPFYCLMTLIAACGSNKSTKISSSDLIEASEQYGYDTVTVSAKDTVCSQNVDQVLRHYPEFYHATKRAKKSYEAWLQQEKSMGMKTLPEVMDVSIILDKTLHGKITVTGDSAWQVLPAIDSIYLQLIANVPDDAKDIDVKKSNIGRTRKAWQRYTEQLQRLAGTVPEECQVRYRTIMATQTKKYLTQLQQTKNNTKYQ